MPLTDDAEIAALLSSARTIALVGASPKSERPSNGVMRFLLLHGYHVIPVNPSFAGQSIHGQTVVDSLHALSEPIDIVDIFRNSAAAGSIVDEAIAIGAKAIWMQLGVINHDAAMRAQAAGLQVVMDRCPAIDIPRLGLPPIT